LKLPLSDGAAVFKAAVTQACQDLISNTALLNELDTEVGDADCGSTLANGARCMCYSILSYILNSYQYIVMEGGNFIDASLENVAENECVVGVCVCCNDVDGLYNI